MFKVITILMIIVTLAVAYVPALIAEEQGYSCKVSWLLVASNVAFGIAITSHLWGGRTYGVGPYVVGTIIYSLPFAIWILFNNSNFYARSYKFKLIVYVCFIVNQTLNILYDTNTMMYYDLMENASSGTYLARVVVPHLTSVLAFCLVIYYVYKVGMKKSEAVANSRVLLYTPIIFLMIAAFYPQISIILSVHRVFISQSLIYSVFIAVAILLQMLSIRADNSVEVEAIDKTISESNKQIISTNV
ncbi:hypothetical protein SAMN02910298_02189 [Pseudobutyrivibrio sp. YE44]|uniref:hypothetical protein n=1 Tax=Pseudobutyrivibrio sp. YE44 TaxID=1520802 RepID=UPI00087F0182|nr:hypothetical protein [Pseudobutyrivibrio sp. YE44]SDB43733.1 hypothetical protein SAMN02910298_02189 [Pseudobutyrivibrio sp. YE44]